MSKLIVKGGNRKRILSGKISVAGAKNTALPLIVSSLLFEKGIVIKNLPKITDVNNLLSIMENIGCVIERKNSEVKIQAPQKIKNIITCDAFNQIRGSILLSGPILAREGKVELTQPGGCDLGDRPIDFFLDAFKKLGAEVVEGDYGYKILAPNGLKGNEIFSGEMSVTLTETLMMTAVFAKGKVVIKNASHDPEVYRLGKMLSENGVEIKGIGTSKITIQGTGMINATGEAIVPPDRIETGSFLIMGILAGKDLRIENCDPSEIEILLEIFKKDGIKNIEVGDDYIYLPKDMEDLKVDKLPPIKVKTHEYPGFPTDLQSSIAVYMSQLNGISFIFESIFERRFGYLNELRKLRVYSEVINRREVLIQGPTHSLKGTDVVAGDLRMGFSLILAGLLASGTTKIENSEILDRGYENLVERLTGIGMEIMRE